MQSDSLDIRIVRVVPAPAARAFDAWLTPADLFRWWGPRDGKQDWETPTVQVDPRIHGGYRIGIRPPRGGEELFARGVYQTIERPSRLAFTFAWEMGHDDPGVPRQIAVRFDPLGDKTRITFHISGFRSIEARDGEIEGWTECLDRLVSYLQAPALAAEDEKTLREMAEKWAAALEKKDIAGLTRGYSPDVLLFDVKPPFQVRGLDAYRANWEECLPYFPAEFKVERRDLRIIVDGNVAFLHCLHHNRPKDPGHPVGSTWMRVTVGFRKISGAWQVVHEHVSVPFDPMTSMAAFLSDPAAASGELAAG